MPFAGLQRGFQHPDTVRLVADQVLVEVVGLDDLRVLQRAVGQLVGVVRHQHFPLAHQLPVVLVRRAAEQVDHVVGAQAVGGADRRVVGDLRGAQHAALPGVVDPGQAALAGLVDGLVDQGLATGDALRRADLAQVVVEAVRLRVTHGRGHHHLHLPAHGREVAVGLHHHFRGVVLVAAGAVAHQVVVEGFEGRPGDRERHAALLVVQQAIAVAGQAHAHGFLGDLRILRLGQGRGAVARVDVELVARVLRQHRLLARRQLVGVLRQVGGRDGVGRLLAGEGIEVALAGVEAGRRAGQAAGPGRNAATGVAGLLRAGGGQVLAQAGHLAGIQGGQGVAAGQSEKAAQQGGAKQLCVHGVPHDQKPMRRLRAMKSRSVAANGVLPLPDQDSSAE
ncbi:hypothetical protein D3C85_425110 [compost metagenome]